jgi:hypothetical protein
MIRILIMTLMLTWARRHFVPMTITFQLNINSLKEDCTQKYTSAWGHFLSFFSHDIGPYLNQYNMTL